MSTYLYWRGGEDEEQGGKEKIDPTFLSFIYLSLCQNDISKCDSSYFR